MPSAQRRYLFDLTTSYHWVGRPSVGIVRTERRIAQQMLEQSSSAVQFVVYVSGALLLLDRTEVKSIISEPEEHKRPQEDLGGSHSSAVGSPVWLTTSLASFNRRILKYPRTWLVQIPQLVKKSVRPLGQLMRRYLKLKISIRVSRITGRRRSHQIESKTHNLRIQFSPNDIYINVGLVWDYIDLFVLYELKERYKFKIAFMCYDLIPIVMENFPNDARVRFEQYILNVLWLSDLIMCISRWSASDLLRFANEYNAPIPKTEIVELANDSLLTLTPRVPGNLELRELSARGFALAVGTFEVRKNYELLIRIWKRWIDERQNDVPVLVIVGMRGWLVEETIRDLLEYPWFGKKVLWLTQMSDAELAWLYRNCRVVLFPSWYEGWGLPVVEGLAFGKPVVASNRSAIVEAGKGIATHLDPDDEEGWFEAIKAVFSNPEQDKCLVNVSVVVSWSDTWRQLQSAIDSAIL